jgi:hypothetical protein
MSASDFLYFQRCLSEATLKDPFKRGPRTMRETKAVTQHFLHYAMFHPDQSTVAADPVSANSKDNNELKVPQPNADAAVKAKSRNKAGESLVLESLYLDVRCFLRLMRDRATVCRIQLSLRLLHYI